MLVEVITLIYFWRNKMVKTSEMDWASLQRQHVKENAEKKRYVKVGLYFPSGLCHDLERALKLGIIDKKTFLIIVEGDRDLKQREKNLKKIKEFLAKHKLTNVYIHRSRVHTLNLKKVLEGRKIDLLFLDICGNYAPEIANWLNKYQECYAYNMRLPMTIAIHPRGKHGAGTNELFKAMNRVSDASLNDLRLNNIPNEILGSEEISCLNLLPDIRNTIKAIYYTLSRRTIRFKKIAPYRFSTTNMVCFDTIVADSKDEEDMTFEAMAKDYSRKVSSNKKLRKQRTMKPVTFKNAYDIAMYMGIFGNFENYSDMPRGKRAHVTMNAKKAGLDPDDVKKKIEKRLQKA